MSFILKNKWVFMGISIVLMIVSVVSLLTRGFNLDTDFAGGIAVTYEIKADFDVADVENIVSNALGADQKASSVQRSNDNEVVIKFGYDNSLENDEARSDFALSKVSAITASLVEKYDPNGAAAVEEEATVEEATEGENAEAEEVKEAVVTLKNQDIISPSTGQELAR